MYPYSQFYPLGAGVASAVLYSLFLIRPSLGLLLFGFLMPLPLFMIGLAFGARSSLIAGLVAASLILLLSWRLGEAALFLLLYALPVTWLVLRADPTARSVIRPEDGGLAALLLVQLMTLALAGVAVSFLLILLFSGEGLQAAGQSVLEPMRSDLSLHLGMEFSDELHRALELMVWLWPGMMGLSWCWMLIINGLLAQFAIRKLGYLQCQPLNLQNFQLTPSLLVVFAITVVGGASLPGEIGFLMANAAVITSLGIFYAGLAVVHQFAARPSFAEQARGLILFGFYVCLLLISIPIVILVTGLGMVTQGLRWYRSREGHRRG